MLNGDNENAYNNNNDNNISVENNSVHGFSVHGGREMGANGIHNEQYPRTLRELLLPELNSIPSCIVPPLNNGHFKFKNGMIQLLPTFNGIEREQPYLHVREFEEVCGTFSDQNCTEELIRLKLFPFSLKDKAKTWLYSLRPRSVTSWRELQTLFFKKFFPTHLTNQYKKYIMNFSQKENETFYQSWERFKDLLNSCPHHGYEKWRTINFFYDGLNSQMRQFVEMMCNGTFFNKNVDEAEEYFDSLAENAQSWDTANSYDRFLKSKVTNSSPGGYII